MRKSFSRALALVSSAPVLAAAVVAGAPAAYATTAPTCGPGSTVIADFYTLGHYHTRIATYDVTSSITNVCIAMFGDVNVVVVVDRGASVTPPTVSQTTGAGSCDQPIIDMTAPVTLSLSVGVDADGRAICLGQDGVTTTVTFNGPSVGQLPATEVWTKKGTTLNTFGSCGSRYALDLAGLGSDYDPYCVTRDNRLV